MISIFCKGSNIPVFGIQYIGMSVFGMSNSNILLLIPYLCQSFIIHNSSFIILLMPSGFPLQDYYSRIYKTYDLVNRLFTFGQDRKWRQAYRRDLPEEQSETNS